MTEPYVPFRNLLGREYICIPASRRILNRSHTAKCATEEGEATLHPTHDKREDNRQQIASMD